MFKLGFLLNLAVIGCNVTAGAFIMGMLSCYGEATAFYSSPSSYPFPDIFHRTLSLSYVVHTSIPTPLL